MSGLTYNDAWEVSLILRNSADAIEKGAAELDKMSRENGYAQGTVDWAVASQQERRDRAKAFRAFARQTLAEASQ
jgi:hypothetical protein